MLALLLTFRAFDVIILLEKFQRKRVLKMRSTQNERATLSVYIPKEQKARLKELSVQENLTLSYLMRIIIDSYLKKIERREKLKNKK